ncbi:SulP family inorganic anion transporter [Rhizobium sp. BR 315]|uniref:SulP family inorganic anion transporter n=1 Tax=Rhizobium sp. BR 315 TaxID=3040014 RepID=UPI003D345510
MNRLSRYLPILQWGRTYDGTMLTSDFLAAVIVTTMLIPQSLAYAMLAGLPAEVGLYASIFPLVAYALFGTSRTLAIGPVAVVSLMSASSISEVAAQGTASYVEGALVLALLSGFILLAMGLFRLGFLANFLSHPVISGFITAAALLISAGQIGHIMGVKGRGDTLPEIVYALAIQLGNVNPVTFAVGSLVLISLYASRKGLKPMLVMARMPARPAEIISRAAPLVTVAATTLLATVFDLGAHGVALVGTIPAGLPSLGFPHISLDLIATLAMPACLISVVGFVESVSVAQTLAAKRRQRVDPDQELIGLGAANVAAGLSAGYPVTGGLARSVVNFEAGAATPLAGAFTAVGIAVAAMYLTPLLSNLPRATLAATIIVAVLSLVDFAAMRRVFLYSRSDFAAMAATLVVTLGRGVELGIVAGVLLSLLLHLYRTSRPHMAVVGQVRNTEHYRNVDRHSVATWPEILSVRVDESLYFANSRYLEDQIAEMVTNRPAVKHVVLMCSAVNAIDASALESLDEVGRRLTESGIGFYLSEVKGPVMDRLKGTEFLSSLNGKVFLSQHEAIQTLTKLEYEPSP